MAGRFEILKDNAEGYRFRLTAADGTVVAESPTFPHLEGVVAGINAVRENAATGPRRPARQRKSPRGSVSLDGPPKGLCPAICLYPRELSSPVRRRGH